MVENILFRGTGIVIPNTNKTPKYIIAALLTNSVPPQNCCAIDCSSGSPVILGMASKATAPNTFGGDASWKYLAVRLQHDSYYQSEYGVSIRVSDSSSPINGYKAYDESGILIGVLSTSFLKIYNGSVAMNKPKICFLTDN